MDSVPCLPAEANCPPGEASQPLGEAAAGQESAAHCGTLAVEPTEDDSHVLDMVLALVVSCATHYLGPGPRPGPSWPLAVICELMSKSLMGMGGGATLPAVARAPSPCSRSWPSDGWGCRVTAASGPKVMLAQAGVLGASLWALHLGHLLPTVPLTL